MSLDYELDPDRLDLLKEKLGKWFSWRQPVIAQTICPFNPDIFERFAEMRRSMADECVDWLRACSDEQVTIILQNRKVRSPSFGETDKRDPVVRDWFSFQEARLAELNRVSPQWYAGGFGHPDHVADFDYWSRMPYFSVSELTCLSVGISPGAFPGKKLKDLCQSADRPKFWSTLEFLLQRYELIKRTFDLHDHNRSVSPERFLDWVDQFEFPVHPVLLNLLRRFHSESGDRKASKASPKSNQREIDSVAKLLVVLAIDHLGYRPRDIRSPIPKEIADLAASMGISISDDTVRKYLKLGSTFIDEGWEPSKKDR